MGLRDVWRCWFILIMLGVGGGVIGCDEPSPPARLRLSITMPQSRFKKATQSLVDTPLIVEAAIEADDLAEPVTACWAGAVQDDVSVSLSVPAGQNRNLSVVVFAWDGEIVSTYKAFVSGLALESGDQSVDVDAEPSATWTLNVALETVGSMPKAAAVEEAQLGILFPSVPVTDGRFVISGLPTGRFFYVVVQYEDGSWSDPLYGCPVFFGQDGTLSRVIDLDDDTC
ncbi:MAG: hypothetical protein J7M25_17765 [Deltaproteobacteria bacterium]|nr:hypothetical protein [Deltaproteobacteria bacterium]